ncbi:MAG: Hsp20/alpha crystallin family protein [Desulfobulbaceae bacterium]|nr:Hsp20/alpha crystallin family protein [Desulfobulbaceae bacterium]HIJ78123.1 Hsp20/alpha crystallin family protein [Deltaproteobacteria bacterium]
MAIIRFGDRPFFRNPWSDFDRMRRELDALFQGGVPQHGGQTGATVFPALNVSADGNNIYVRAEIPGVSANLLDIAIEGDTLTIKGERETCSADDKLSYHRRELECGNFSRAVTLPTKVQVDKVQAKAIDGIVTITLPKAEVVKPKQIKVNVG